MADDVQNAWGMCEELKEGTRANRQYGGHVQTCTEAAVLERKALLIDHSNELGHPGYDYSEPESDSGAGWQLMVSRPSCVSPATHSMSLTLTRTGRFHNRAQVCFVHSRPCRVSPATQRMT